MSEKLSPVQLPRFLVADDPLQASASDGQYVIHNHTPRFIAKIGSDGDGRTVLTPAFIDNPAEFSQAARQDALAAAMKFYADLGQRLLDRRLGTG